MSAPNWLSDAQSFQNGESGSFPSVNDPVTNFMQPHPSTSLDFNSPQTQQLQQRMQNGSTVNGSPASLNAMYQTQTTIPSKRPRPTDDNISGSPQPYPGTLPGSRSQTPHGSYPGFQGPVNGASFPGNPPYQNMQRNTMPTSQSPSMQNQPFNPPTAQNRVQTMSPSPFSPATQNFGNQASPPHSESVSRVNTPQNNGSNYPHGTPYGIGGTQPFVPQAGPNMNGAPHPQYSQNLQQDQMMMEARMRQMNQMAALRGAPNPQGVPFNPSMQLPNQMSNVQLAQMRAQQAQQGNPRQHQVHQQILHTMIGFARQRNLPFTAQPGIAGKVQSSVQLFYGVFKMGGSERITREGQWPQVARLLGYPAQLLERAALELQRFWQTQLADFELYYTQQHQQQRDKAAAEAMRAGNNAPLGDQHSPIRPPQDQGAGLMQPPSNLQTAFQSPSKQMLGAQANGRNALPNGYVDSLRAGPQPPLTSAHGRPPPGPLEHPNIDASKHKSIDAPKQKKKSAPSNDPHCREYWEVRDGPRKVPLTEMFWPTAFKLELEPSHSPKGENQQSESAEDEKRGTWPTKHGGLPIKDTQLQDSVDSLLKYKLRAPMLEELGPIDIRTIILSLRSGIRGEVRHALDTIASLSTNKSPPSLDQCDDLVEAIVECATDQVDLLAEHASEVSDAMLINSYEETVRGCKVELDGMQDPKKFGTLEHELDVAVNRLICITYILRNFVFSDASHRALSDPVVLKMLATVTRHLGTRHTMLRSHLNALDFSKDVVIFLSQIAYKLDFQSKDEALSILHFLISFAPLPEPFSSDDHAISFSSYTPSLNRYLPHAIDALAKLLTRETNRNFFRSIFTYDINSSPPYELMTRTFGLAISPVPEDTSANSLNMITGRIPFMVQGLLVADIIVGMIPSTDHQLALSWLNSKDRFVSRLLRTLGRLSHGPPDHVPPAQPHTQPPPIEITDPYGHVMVTHRGLSMLKRLVERGKDCTADGQSLPSEVFPKVQTVVSALLNERTDAEISRQLCMLQDLDA